jgi:subtilase family serine protease
MTTNERRVLATPAAVVAGLLAALSLAVAQPVRVTQRLDASKATVLIGNRTSKALPEDDDGPLDVSRNIGGITIQLKPSASQAADLQEFLEQQRIPSSPDYHRWLTPEQYATRFGVSPADLEQVTTWLQTEGLSVDYVARARTWVMFSGTAGRVGHTFRTEIHRYNIQGKLHFANTADPSVPSALAPVICSSGDWMIFTPVQAFPLPTSRPPAGPIT